MDAKVMELTLACPLLSVSEASEALDMSKEEVCKAFAAIVHEKKNDVLLLSRSVEEAASSGNTTVALHKVNPSDDTSPPYALLSLSYASQLNVSYRPPALQPNTTIALRVYPVVSRNTLEDRAAADPAAVFIAHAASTCPTASAASEPPLINHNVEKNAGVSPLRDPLSGLPCREVSGPPRFATLPDDAPPSPAADVKPTSPAAATELPPAVSPFTRESEADGPAAEVRTPTIFDKMKAAAASKRPRKAEDAVKSVKAAKTEKTTSVTKLARASRRKANTGAAKTTVLPSRSFLDEDCEQEATPRDSSEDHHDLDETVVGEEAPAFDVVGVPVANDEVTLCDDAPPLAFRPAPTVQAASPCGRELSVKEGAKGAAETGAAQITLGSFFSPAVLSFQACYERELQTDMKVENGEYVCYDRICYRNTSTGETMSEDEYLQRSSELLHAPDPHSTTPNHKDAGSTTASPSTSAASTTRTANNAPRAAAQNAKKMGGATAAAPPNKTLFSFFKKTSS